MAKNFCKYLLEKGVVDESTLVQGFIDQLEECPSYGKIVFDQGLLETKDLLNVFLNQQETGSDFRSSCEGLGVWNEQLEESINRELKVKYPPLVAVLAKRGIEQNKLHDALNDYLKTVETQESTPKTEVKVEEKVLSSVVKEEETTLEQIDFNPRFKSINKEILEDFLELFNEEKKSELENLLVGLEKMKSDDGKEVENIFRTLYRELHTLKGCARFIGANLFERMVQEWEELITFGIEKGNDYLKEKLQSFSEIGLSVLDTLWEIRLSLTKDTDEKTFWENDNNKNKFLNNLGKLRDSLAEQT